MTKILVIDDEPSIVNLVTAYLKPEGYEIFTATELNCSHVCAANQKCM